LADGQGLDALPEGGGCRQLGAVLAGAAAARGPALGDVVTELRAVEDDHLVTEVGRHAEDSAERAHVCAESSQLRMDDVAAAEL